MSIETVEQDLFDIAGKWLHTKEVPGHLNNPAIKRWIKEAADWLDGDDSETAWCGCFRNFLAARTFTGSVKAPYRAKNWKRWGRPIDITYPCNWPQGATVILRRPGGHHVALFNHVTSDQIWLRGGNQNDEVCDAPFEFHNVVSVRVHESS